MNNAATSKEALLAISVRLASEQGITALNIRDIAARCDVSIGCVYNYFPSKASLVASTVEAIWEGIFHQAQQQEQPKGFKASVRRIFDSIREGSGQYPSFLTSHTMNFGAGELGEGRAVMERRFDHMKRGMLQILEKDPDVCADAFSPDFTREDFVGFVFDSLIMLSTKQAPSCDILLALIDRAIC
jgi:AcrR family transcriptional regulator